MSAPVSIFERLATETEISDFVTAGAILVAGLGWLVTYRLKQRLQRRQLAINLINDHRFSSLWTHSSRRVFDIARTQIDYNWIALVTTHRNHITNTLSPSSGQPQDPPSPSSQLSYDQDLYFCLIRVMNYFEFLSVAALGGAAAEYIIKNQLRSNFVLLYSSTAGLITWLREQPYGRRTNFEHFEMLARRWSFDKPPNFLLRSWHYLKDVI